MSVSGFPVRDHWLLVGAIHGRRPEDCLFGKRAYHEKNPTKGYHNPKKSAVSGNRGGLGERERKEGLRAGGEKVEKSGAGNAALRTNRGLQHRRQREGRVPGRDSERHGEGDVGVLGTEKRSGRRSCYGSSTPTSRSDGKAREKPRKNQPKPHSKKGREGLESQRVDR